METPQPGPADGEERPVELRPRTRSNPEGAEDRRSSTGSLGNSNPSTPQPAVGSRVEGEGEASTSDSPPSSTTHHNLFHHSPDRSPYSGSYGQCHSRPAHPHASGQGQAQTHPGSSPSGAPIPPTAEFQLRAPRVNCPEKVIICLDLSEEMSSQKLESFNGSKTNALPLGYLPTYPSLTLYTRLPPLTL
ncbi:BRISC and BRCA1-A complex member 1-like [Salvelinus sp. IW2-2015]|uniref:BRISC and BRCA1-A complex member 1-like n=1 Tax=Salvelinus sp. IW2-2015 TaxID=2691554 RepID=UPI0038D4FDC3